MEAGFTGLGTHQAEPDLPAYDFSNIEWGAKPWGYDHGSNVAKLSLVILSFEFSDLNKNFERGVLWTASLFHDLDRKEEEDDGHALRSAEAAEKFLRTTSYWGDERFRDYVTRLIANHENDNFDNDPLMRSLKDADALDACRVHPGMNIGLMYFKKRKEGLFTEWAKKGDVQKRYMQYRGW